MGPDEWDARYAGTDLVWGPGANRWVVEYTSDLPPGRAVDLACGEGRNALFLAERGWTVIGVDFSARAI
jgi:SAM-dependent methyltransferase